MKKIPGLFLILMIAFLAVMLFSCSNGNALQALEYELIEDGTAYEVSGIGTVTDADVVIPKEFNGIPVTRIGAAAFYGCKSFKSITIPSSVEEIDGYAFAMCTNLSKIKIPKNVTSIGYRTFYGCINLEKIEIDKNSKMSSIDSYAFDGCEGLESVTIPNSVAYIGKNAFSSCINLSRITIPENVIYIGDGAFEACYKLKEVYNCSSLLIEKKSSSNGGVGYFAINVYTPEEGESVISTTKDGYIFAVCDTNNYLLGYKGEKTELMLPENYNGESYDIYSYAFFGDADIVSITVPDAVTSIGDYAFSACKNLSRVEISENSDLIKIGEYAFAECKNLVRMTIPENTQTIGNSAFFECYKLVEVYNLSSLRVEAESSENGYIGYYALNIYTEMRGSSKIEIIDGYVFYADKKIVYLIGYLGDDAVLNLTLPENYDGMRYHIYQYALCENTNIKSVIIPYNVKSIRSYAFNGCTNLNIAIFEKTKKWQEKESGIEIDELNDPESSAVLLKKLSYEIHNGAKYTK